MPRDSHPLKIILALFRDEVSTFTQQFGWQRSLQKRSETENKKAHLTTFLVFICVNFEMGTLYLVSNNKKKNNTFCIYQRR